MAKREQFVNNAVTELTASMNSSVTTASVQDGSVFPADGDFRILVGDELMLVTARSVNTLTVVRGQENTAATAHNSSDQITAILTKTALENYAEENTWHGNTSPALRIYKLSDGSRATGSDFSWVNQGTATRTDRGNRIVLECPQNAGTQVRGLFQSAPTPPYEIILAARGVGERANSGQFGLSFRESGTGKLMSIVKLFNEKLEIPKHTSPTVFSALLGSSLNWGWGPGVLWLKIEDDNTDLNFYTGPNGQDWQEIGTEGRTTFMSGGPDEVGFHANPETSNSFPILVEVYHFGEV